jgi:potassium voltage-gated channel KQT-like subfamily protein 1
LVIGVICTIGEYEEKITQKFTYVEICLLIFFASEYLIRVWSAGCRAKFKGWIGRFHFMRTPISLIDLFVVLASSIVIGFHISGRIGSANPVMAASPALRIIRFFQILRMLHVDRKAHSWKLLLNVAYLHRIELITTMYMGFIVLIITSYLVYLAERDYINAGVKPFESYADALWFGIVTVATIGYGDLVPHTWTGRIITACLSMIGIAFFSLPAGILGSGFALHVQQKEKQKMFHKQYPAAAQLIQAAWRMHATSRLHQDNATWRLYKLVDSNLAEKFLSRSYNNTILRRRSTVPNAGKEKF